jgi:hypothetical protein
MMKFGEIVMAAHDGGRFPGVVIGESKNGRERVLFIGGDIEEVAETKIEELDEPSYDLRRDLMLEYLVAKADEK